MTNSIKGPVSLLFVAAVAVGGFFYPLLGLATAALLLAAVATTLFRPRVFCSAVCPRGPALGFVLSRVSRRRPLPAVMRTDGFRKALCGFMLFCVIGSSLRLRSDIGALGAFFWGLCVVSLAAGVVLGIFFKPRSWCAVCPMGTMQDTLGAAVRSSSEGRGKDK